MALQPKSSTAENPLTNIASAKIYEGRPFISLTAHKWNTHGAGLKIMWASDAKTKDIIMESMAKRRHCSI